MKAIKILIPMLCIALLFSGCGGFHLASSIDDLISPVAPAGADASGQSAMDAYCKGGYSVKIPAAGKYTTSYIFYDFDDDGQKEALAFYEPNDALGKIDMAVLEQSGENWQVIANIQGEGTDVYCVDLRRQNGISDLLEYDQLLYQPPDVCVQNDRFGPGIEIDGFGRADAVQCLYSCRSKQ